MPGAEPGLAYFRDRGLTVSRDPDWLAWAREIQAIAQTGLAFTKDPYDAERYVSLRALAARIMAAHTDSSADRILDLFSREAGYATPKIDVRGAVFDGAGRILLVREALDGGRWTLPGGWADVNQTLSECVLREIREESGYIAKIGKLAAVWDRTRQGHPPGPFSMAKVCFVCKLEGGAPSVSLETSGVGWFSEEALPGDLSLGRTLPHQLQRMFTHWREPSLPTEFD
ncbi:MAG: NUDIX hydrolase [Acetobacteraceae bacterium]|nr:NUDIX hydrolase [Acetobacteraceae bacterium]